VVFTRHFPTDDPADGDLAQGESADVDIPLQSGVTKAGDIVQLGSAVLVRVKVTRAAELRVFYSSDGPAANGGTFVQRGDVERLCSNVEWLGVLVGFATNLRLRITSLSASTNSVTLDTSLL